MATIDLARSERWARAWSGRRLGPLPLGPLLAWQAGLVAVVVALLAAPALVVPALLVFIAIAVLTIARLGGRPAYRRLAVAAHRSVRRRQARTPARAEGFPLAAHDSLVPLLYLRPDLSVTTVAGRSGSPVGVVWDGSGFAALLAAADEAVVPSMRPVGVGIGTLADLCDPDGVGVDSVQLVVRVLPAPATASADTLPAVAASYGQLNTGRTAAAVSWTVALRLAGSGTDPGAVDVPALDTAADLHPVYAQVRSKADRSTKALAAAGLPCRMLDDGQVLATLAGSLDSDRRRPRPELARVSEGATSVIVDGLAHTTVWIRARGVTGMHGHRPVDTGELVAALSDAAVIAGTISVLVSVSERRRLRVSSFVRLTAANPDAAAAAVAALDAQLSSRGLESIALTGEQLPGLLATVPLGGGRL